ncbi:MAG: hypothetical protein AB1411_15715 [Nitrospirota bacterium]
MNYRVQILAVVRVPVDVDAETPVQAADLADTFARDRRLLEHLFNGVKTGQTPIRPSDLVCQYRGEIIDYYVEGPEGGGAGRRTFVTPEELRACRAHAYTLSAHRQ